MLPVPGYKTVLFISVLTLSGCASTDTLLQRPTVDLTSVELGEMNVARQTFLLGINVYNPNPFPLPVQGLRYQLRLNDQYFAGGETQGSFTVPAAADGNFVISVDLDLLRSGAQVTSVLRSGLRDRLDYELHGNLALNIPGAQSMRFSSSGTVMVQSALDH